MQHVKHRGTEAWNSWTFNAENIEKTGFSLYIYIYDQQVGEIAGSWVACSY